MKAQKIIFSFILTFSLLVVFAFPAKAEIFGCRCKGNNKEYDLQAANVTECADLCQQLCESPNVECIPYFATVGGNNNSTNTTVVPVTLTDPLGGVTVSKLMANVISAIFGIVGSLALLMFILGGLIWMTAAGNQEKVKKGRDIIIWTVIGLAVIFFAYAIVRFVLTIL